MRGGRFINVCINLNYFCLDNNIGKKTFKTASVEEPPRGVFLCINSNLRRVNMQYF